MSDGFTLNHGLWLPPHWSDLVIVEVSGEAIRDPEALEEMFILNQAGIDWMQGKLDTGTYMDMLEHYGHDPLEFVGGIEQDMEILIRHG
jgi:hypothetical protein